MKTISAQLSTAASAVDLFLFAFHVEASVNAGLITPSSFQTSFKIHTEASSHLFGERIYSPEKLRTYAQNLVLSTEATLSIVMDDALQSLGGRDPFDTSDLGSARNIVYMIRCAFAHGAFKPRWQCSPKYQRIYAVRAASVQFDGKLCNGKELKPDDYGGLEGHMRLLAFCLKALRDPHDIDTART
jgi:hypothetical protein